MGEIHEIEPRTHDDLIGFNQEKREFSWDLTKKKNR
jgi:hypothetical protein